MFHKAGKETLADKVAEQLISSILQGEFREGDFLPSEHRLCESFETSRTTIRAALTILVQRGYIETSRGKGSRVTASREWASAPTIGESDESRRFLEAAAAVRGSLIGRSADFLLLKQQHEKCLRTEPSQLFEELLRFRSLLVRLFSPEPVRMWEERLVAGRAFGSRPEDEILAREMENQEKLLKAMERHEGESAFRLLLNSRL